MRVYIYMQYNYSYSKNLTRLFDFEWDLVNKFSLKFSTLIAKSSVHSCSMYRHFIVRKNPAKGSSCGRILAIKKLSTLSIPTENSVHYVRSHTHTHTKGRGAKKIKRSIFNTYDITR